MQPVSPKVDRKLIEKATATKWQLFKARLFGTPFSYSTEDGTVSGYRYNGVIYVTLIVTPLYKNKEMMR